VRGKRRGKEEGGPYQPRRRPPYTVAPAYGGAGLCGVRRRSKEAALCGAGEEEVKGEAVAGLQYVARLCGLMKKRHERARASPAYGEVVCLVRESKRYAAALKDRPTGICRDLAMVSS